MKLRHWDRLFNITFGTLIGFCAGAAVYMASDSAWLAIISTALWGAYATQMD